MPSEDPTIESPQFQFADYPRPDPRPPLHRTPFGWILLFALFALLIARPFLEEASRKSGGARSYFQQENAIRQVIRTETLGRQFKRDTGRPASSLQPEIQKLKDARKDDPVAARLYVVARHELGEMVTKEDLDLVRKTGKPEDAAFARIYERKHTPGEARALAAQLPDKGFAYRAARMHALDQAGDDSARKQLAPVWKTLGMAAILLGMLLGAGIGVLLWLVYYQMRSQGRLAPAGHPAEPLTGAEADRFAMRAVLIMGTFLLVSQLVAPAVGSVLASLLALVMILALHRMPVMGLRIPLARVGVDTRRLGKDLLWGFLGYLATLPIIALMLGVTVVLSRLLDQQPHHPVQDMIGRMNNPVGFLMIFFMAAVVAPVWEEIMFRGTLTPALGRLFGRPVGIAAGAFLFASIHPQGVTMWLALGSIGAMAAVLAYQTRSLVPSIVLHALNNGVILTLSFLML